MSDSIMDDAEVVSADAEVYEYGLGARIKVIGVGGGGGNAVQHMIDSGLPGVQFISANTDRQALNKNGAEVKLQLGEKQTKGRGAGANPKVGREAAMESINAIRDAIGDAEMLFVTAGMGGGTGTGGAPVVAQVAREMNVLTVGVVTKPFSFEGAKRQKAATEGLQELKQYVDCLITIPNDRLIGLAPKKASFIDMLERSNQVLYQAVKGISDVVNGDGMINLDFADVRTTMSEAGLALMGTGVGEGENRARDAAQKAIASPLLEDVSLDTAKAILYNITASRDITANEIAEIGKMIQDAAPEECNIIFGVVFDDNIGDQIFVTLIATGIESQDVILPEPEPEVIRPAVVKKFPKQSVQEQREAGSSRPVRHFPFNQNQASPASDAGRMSESEENSYSPRGFQSRRNALHKPGALDFTYDEDDVPAFIRRQAD